MHWLDWAIREFSLAGVAMQPWQHMTGKQICAMGKESFLARAPAFMGDILWEHLEMLQKGNHNFFSHLPPNQTKPRNFPFLIIQYTLKFQKKTEERKCYTFFISCGFFKNHYPVSKRNFQNGQNIKSPIYFGDFRRFIRFFEIFKFKFGFAELMERRIAIFLVTT